MKKLILIMMLMFAGILIASCGGDVKEKPDQPVVEDPIEVVDPADSPGETPENPKKDPKEIKDGKEDPKGDNKDPKGGKK